MKHFYLLFIGAALLWTSPFKANAQSYCSPSYLIGCSLTDDYISNFTLVGDNGTAINNNSNCTTGSFGFGGGYADYTTLAAAEITTGESYQVSISTGAPIAEVEKVKIWIDWNNDGTFDEDEVIGLIDGIDLLTSTSTFSFTVPADATAGKRRLRARMVTGASVGSIQPCGSAEMGEAEDYSVQVVQACPEPSVDGINITPDIADHYYFTSVNAENVDSYFWQFGDGEFSSDETPTHAYASSGTYEVTLTVSNECGEATTSSTIAHVAASLETEGLVNMEIYPNPTSSTLTIEANGNYTGRIVNTRGQEVLEFGLINNKQTVQVNHLPKGVYFLQLHNETDTILVRKVVIQ